MSKNSIGFSKKHYKIIENDSDSLQDEKKNKKNISSSDILFELSMELQHKLQITAENLDLHLFDLTFTGMDVCKFLSTYNKSFKEATINKDE